VVHARAEVEFVEVIERYSLFSRQHRLFLCGVGKRPAVSECPLAVRKAEMLTDRAGRKRFLVDSSDTPQKTLGAQVLRQTHQDAIGEPKGAHEVYPVRFSPIRADGAGETIASEVVVDIKEVIPIGKKVQRTPQAA
jgi:hypothetical protein